MRGSIRSVVWYGDSLGVGWFCTELSGTSIISQCMERWKSLSCSSRQ